MHKRSTGTIESPWAPSTIASASATPTPAWSARNQLRRAESSTPAMPITRRPGKPSFARIRCTIVSSGLVTTITKASGECSRMSAATLSMTRPLTSKRSERLMPGLRGRPAVTITRSEPRVSRASSVPTQRVPMPSMAAIWLRSKAMPAARPGATSIKQTSPAKPFWAASWAQVMPT